MSKKPDLDLDGNPMPAAPKQIVTTKQKFKVLFELVKWYESMPKIAQKLARDSFHEDIQEQIQTLINYNDKTDNYYTIFVEVRGKKVFTLLANQVNDKSVWIEVIGK